MFDAVKASFEYFFWRARLRGMVPDSCLGIGAFFPNGYRVNGSCKVIVRDGNNPDTKDTSDHRPILIAIEFGASEQRTSACTINLDSTILGTLFRGPRDLATMTPKETLSQSEKTVHFRRVARLRYVLWDSSSHKHACKPSRNYRPFRTAGLYTAAPHHSSRFRFCGESQCQYRGRRTQLFERHS